MLKLTIEVQGLEPLIESIKELNNSISSLSPKGTSININVNKDKQKEVKEEEDTKEPLEPISEHTEKNEDLSTLTVVKLRTIAEDNGIDSTGLKKKELIDAIEGLTTEIEKEIEEAKETDTDPGEEKKNEDPKEEKALGNLTIEDIREVFVSKNSKENRAKLKEILGKFEVKKVTDLEPKDFQEVLAELEAI